MRPSSVGLIVVTGPAERETIPRLFMQLKALGRKHASQNGWDIAGDENERKGKRKGKGKESKGK